MNTSNSETESGDSNPLIGLIFYENKNQCVHVHMCECMFVCMAKNQQRKHLHLERSHHTPTCVSVKEKHLWGYRYVSNAASKRYHINILITGSVGLSLRGRLNVVTDEGSG